MSILDMVWPSNPLTGTGAGAPPGDPYALSAQLGATPQMQNGQPNPQYSQLQQQIAQAQRAQNARGLGMGLMQGAGAMLGATDQYGRPAKFAQALGAGIPAAAAGDQQYLQQKAAQEQAMLEAQRSGQQMAQGQQQMQLGGQQLEQGKQQLQMGQYELQTKEYLMSKFGVPDQQAAILSQQIQSGQGRMQLLEQLKQNPATAGRAQALESAGPAALGQMSPEQFADGLFGKVMNSVEMKATEAYTNAENAAAAQHRAMAGYYEGGAGTGMSRADQAAYTRANSMVRTAMSGMSGIAKSLGINTPDPYSATDAVYQQMKGEWPPGFPPHEMVQGLATSGRLHSGDTFTYNGQHYAWTGQYLMPLQEGFGGPGGPAGAEAMAPEGPTPPPPEAP